MGQSGLRTEFVPQSKKFFSFRTVYRFEKSSSPKEWQKYQKIVIPAVAQFINFFFLKYFCGHFALSHMVFQSRISFNLTGDSGNSGNSGDIGDSGDG
jgi:hypothetical protein